MKSAFTLSILLNLALAGGLVFFARQASRPAVAPQPVLAVESTAPVTKVAVTSPVLTRPETAAFRWSQLESTNYHEYVANLRTVGCPETTVRAIVTADVQAVFGRRRRELEQELAKLEDGSLVSQLRSFDTAQKIKADLVALPDEESRLVADLLGVPAMPVAANRPTRHTPPPSPPALPLVFQDVDPSLMSLTPDEQQVIAQLRQNFTQSVGGLNQDPDDEGYLARWQQAQPEADTMLEGMLGNAFYQNYQMAAAASGHDPATAKP